MEIARVKLFTGLFAICILPLASIHGQNITGTIVGQITDPSGSVVPGAEVTVRNEGTGLAVRASMDASGTCSAPNLMAGMYEVAVTAAGFESYKASGLQLLASQTVRHDVKLQLGEIHQTFNVIAQAPLVHTDTPTIGGSLTSRQISELPLAGQAIDGLMQLAPGVLWVGGTSTIANPRVSGSSYWGGSNFNLNGISNNHVGNGGAIFTTPTGPPGISEANLPPVQALQEFKIDSANLNAEFRAVASITMVTRQGTNSFHGDAYEFFENTKLNANDLLFNATGQPRAPLNRNQFGADLGGPIRKNKAFFFADYYGLRQRSSSIVSASLPSMAMRSGDFSALCPSFNASGLCIDALGTQLYNSWTGEPFYRNQLPPNMITPQARALLKFLPAPTDLASPGLPNGKPNYIVPSRSALGVNNGDLRVDALLWNSETLAAFVHYNVGSPWSLSNANPPAYGNISDEGTRNITASLSDTHTFNRNTVNDFRAAWVLNRLSLDGQNTDFKPWVLFPQMPVSDNGGLPTMSMSGYSGMFKDLGKGYPYSLYDIEISDNFTHVHGSHTLKFGIDETGMKIYIRQGGPPLSAPLANPLGAFTFNGAWTGNKGWPGHPVSQGNAFADFLLGTANTSNYAIALTEEQTTSRNWELYAQDTWQASSRLTINYGMRYVYQSPWQFRDNRVSYLNLTHNKLAIPQDSDTLTAPSLAVPRLIDAYPTETTKQAGWPISYFKTDRNNFGPRFGFAYRPFTGNKTVIRGGWGVFYNFIPGYIGQFENQFNPPWRDGSTFSSLLPGKPSVPFLPDLTFADPFPSGKVNAPPANPLIYMTERNNVNPVVQQWNFTVEQQFAQSWMARTSYVGARTHHQIWYAHDINRPDVQQPNVPLQAQRPYQPWAQILDTHTGGRVNFTQVQLELVKRFASGFSFQAEYAFTRSLDNTPEVGGPQNPHNFNADYGNSREVPRHQLVVNYLYTLPFGKGERWMNRGGAQDAVLGGWSISGITFYRTGTPFSIGFSVPSSIVGWWGGRADAVAGADPYLPSTGSHDIVNGIPYINVSAFAPPAPWQWGNSAYNTMYGPGAWNYDIGIQKYFHIPGTEWHRLQFRTELLNAFNHFNPGFPFATIADTRDGGLPNPNAGKIFGGSDYLNNRIIQLSMRYMF